MYKLDPRVPILKFIGRGSMFNVAEGNNSAYWKNDKEDSMLLIDCGCTVFQRIQSLRLLDGIDELVIIITHTHSDHIGSLPDLLFYCKFCKPNIKVNLFFSKESKLKKYLNINGILRLDMPNIQMVEYINNKTLQSSVGLSITPVADSSHNIIHKNGYIVPSYGFIIRFNIIDATIYYSGDTKQIPYGSIEKIIPSQNFVNGTHQVFSDGALRTEGPDGLTYPHYNIYDLCDDITNVGYPLDQVFIMHLDCEGVIDEAKRLGMQVVEIV